MGLTKEKVRRLQRDALAHLDGISCCSMGMFLRVWPGVVAAGVEERLMVRLRADGGG